MRILLTAVVALATAAPALLAPAATAHTPSPGAVGGGPIASRAVTAEETVALRRRYFGAENVDATGAVRKDRVILSWVGVVNFAMAIRGHVVLLDAWVPRGGTTGYVPSSPAELAALRPEAIFIGHAHFDHAADAVPIAVASGATLVGSADQCAELLSRVTTPMPPRCVSGLPPGSAPGTRAAVDVLGGVGTDIFQSLHSAVAAPDAQDGLHVPVLPLPSTTQLEHPPSPQDLAHIVGVLPDAEAGTVLYRFATGDFSMVWNDSAGPLTDQAPGALERMRELRPVDLHVGAIQGFGQFTNGMRDIRQYIEAVGSPLFVPGHHDDWAAGITTKGENYREPLRQELARIPADRRPQVRFISDPADYVKPEILTFPVAFEPVRLTRRCLAGQRLRLALSGDVADVRSVRFRVGARTVTDTTAPFGTTLAGRRAGRLRAVVTEAGSPTRTLRRTLPSCRRG